MPNTKKQPSKKHEKLPQSPRPRIATKPIDRPKGSEKLAAHPSPGPSPKAKPKVAGSDDRPLPNSLPTSFKIIAGSYEKLLYGLEGSTTTHRGSDFLFHLKPIFIFPAHVSCIKAVAASPNGGKWLATGSADEIVKVWDLRRRKEIGGLIHHEGSITHLHFPSRSHLLSASEDGTLCLFRARDWAVLRSLKGHKGRVNSVAVHPSGKVGLSVGKDKTLRMWDLMRGKGSASTKLGKEGEIVRWSVDGSMFVVQSQATADIYSTDMRLLHSITHPSRQHDVKFCKRVNGEGEVLLVAAEDKKLTVYDISKEPNTVPKVIAEMIGHSNRVKAVDTLSLALPTSTESTSDHSFTTIACTVSSDGKIHVYDLASLPPPSATPQEIQQINPVAEYDTKGTRLTCITIAEGEPESTEKPTIGKRKRSGDDDNESDHVEDEDEDEDAWESKGDDDEELDGPASSENES